MRSYEIMDEDISGLEIVNNVEDSFRGGYQGTLIAKTPEQQVGYLNYSIYRDRPSIHMIYVAPEFRRSRIARQMLKALQELSPDEEIDWGITTPAGSKLRGSIDYIRRPNPEIIKKKQKLAGIKSKLAQMKYRLEQLEKTNPELARKYISTVSDRWNELNSLEYRLENELYLDKGEYSKIIPEDELKEYLEEIDRRGFIRGLGSAAATVATPGLAQPIPVWQQTANIALQKGSPAKWPGYEEDDGKWPAAKNAPPNSLIAWRGDAKTGKIETLPTLIRKETVAKFLNAYKLCRDNKLLPIISPEIWAALLLVEGRSDFGYNGPDLIKKYNVSRPKQQGGQNNVNNNSWPTDKFGPKLDVSLRMTPIRQGMNKLGIPDTDWRIDFCELINSKLEIVKRLGIPFYQAWQGGKDFLNRYRAQLGAIKHPKNKPLMDFIKGILGG